MGYLYVCMCTEHYFVFLCKEQHGKQVGGQYARENK